MSFTNDKIIYIELKKGNVLTIYLELEQGYLKQDQTKRKKIL